MIELRNVEDLAARVELLLGHDGGATRHKRIIVALAGPPAAGKTTLSESLRNTLRERGKCHPVALQMDGFHHQNDWLIKHDLHRFKGRIDTFDIDQLLNKTKALKPAGQPVTWPVYSREIHAPVADGVRVSAQHDVAILEGNYLLIDAPHWSDLHALFDLTVFVDASDAAIETRLLERHVKGGKTREEARIKIDETDLPNVAFVRNHSLPADFLIRTA